MASIATRSTTAAAEIPNASQLHRILFVLPRGLEEAQLVGGLDEMNRNWEFLFTSDSDEALEIVGQAACHAVVADLLDPEVGGVALVRRVMEHSPETLRLGLSAPWERETLQKAGAPVHQFLAKPCDLKVLKAVLARAFAGREFLEQESIRHLVSGLKSLPILPSLYNDLMAELRSEDPSLERAGQIVARDIGLTSKILQLVNSAFFGLGRPLSHPSEAAMFLGAETLKALVLSLQVFAQFHHLKLREFNIDELWKHCWTTAVLAKRICEAEEAGRETAREAFVAGLLHDLGKLVLASNSPEKFQAALQAAAHRGGVLWEEEYQVYGASHAEVGGYLLSRWGLPGAVVQAVAFHHRPDLARFQSFCAVTAVHVANAFSKHGGSASDEHRVNAGYLRSIGMSGRLEEWRELCLESLRVKG